MRNSILVSTFVLCIVAAPLSASEPPPNIVLFMADDMGLGDTSAYQDFTGNSDQNQLDTPSMERLASMGVRFTDAHTPSSRCTGTRYALLTGRYPWRSRLKHFVLFGSQGDPMIEPDRPTIATMLKRVGYRTAMFGKWHVGLRYRQANGDPAAGFQDAAFTEPMFDTPLDHGFDICRFTSRSHGTSGPRLTRKANSPKQNVGPGHMDGRTILGATNAGRKLVDKGEDAYVLHKLGSRHSNNAITFLEQHTTTESTRALPFFLYYPANSNHGPYTPDTEIGRAPVAGASRSKAGKRMTVRYDYIYENDVALGRILDYLEQHADPRRPGHMLIENAIVIFTSDNGAERDDTKATGPFRSNKGSVYEGGHRVPFLVAWPAGGVGNGDPNTIGLTNPTMIGHQQIFATLTQAAGGSLPNLALGEKGGEDSTSALDAWRGKQIENAGMLYHDHKQAKDPAVAALRLDNPAVDGRTYPGQWKVLFEPQLLRRSEAVPTELYNLKVDPVEQDNRIADESLQDLVRYLSRFAQRQRRIGGHRFETLAGKHPVKFAFSEDAKVDSSERRSSVTLSAESKSGWTVQCTIKATDTTEVALQLSAKGLGVQSKQSGSTAAVDSGEALELTFDQDVIVEYAALVAGEGSCGGFYQVGKSSFRAIYCVDADIDTRDQSGVLSDIGLVKAGVALRLDSSPLLNVESPGCWRLQSISVRPCLASSSNPPTRTKE